MRNKIFLCAVIMLLTGCADTQPNAPRSDYPEAPEAAETLPIYPERETSKALDYLYHNISSHRYPDNYAGAYVDNDIVVILTTDGDTSPYEYMSRYDCVAFGQAETSLNELNRVFNDDADRLIEEHDIDFVAMSVDEENNAVTIWVFDGYTDEEKAEIDSYFEEYPIRIEYVNYRIQPL